MKEQKDTMENAALRDEALEEVNGGLKMEVSFGCKRCGKTAKRYDGLCRECYIKVHGVEPNN